MRRVNAVSFDLDGTLVTHRHIDLFWNQEVPRMFAELHGLPFEEAYRQVWQEYDRIGESDLRWYLPGYWFRKFGFEADVNEVVRRLRNAVEVYPDARCVLSRLSCKLALISNAAREFVELALEELGVKFDVVISTVSDLRAASKSEAVFKRACEMLGEAPKSVVHVGDSELFDYQIPRRIGMQAYLIDRQGLRSGPHVLRSLDGLERALKS